MGTRVTRFKHFPRFPFSPPRDRPILLGRVPADGRARRRKGSAMPRVLIVFNRPVLPAAHPDAASEAEILDTVERAADILAGGGFEVDRLGIDWDVTALPRAVAERRPDAVFNLFEGLASQTETEVTLAGTLDWLGVPYTGSPPVALAIGRDKVRTKHLLAGAGLPTPPCRVVHGLPAPEWDAPFPRIVKPACQDASVGIEQGSVVTTHAQMEARVAWVLERYGGPVLVERFVPGREFLVGVVEDRTGELQVLGFSEIVFRPAEGASPLWPIYSYDAKWSADSPEYKATPLDAPVELPPALTARLQSLARDCFRLLGCRDYARIDVRLSPEGEPFVLEVNPNPFIHSISVIDGLEAIGRTHEGWIRDLASAAVARGRARAAA